MSIQGPKTAALFDRAYASLVNGVSSGWRYWGRNDTLVLTGGKGGHVFDADGKRYIDFHMGFGPIILGHGDEHVTAAVSRAVANGTTFAFTQEQEVIAAETVKKAADQMLKRALDKKDVKTFREMAKRHSEDAATAESGGDLHFFAAEGGEGPAPAIRKAVFSLKKTGDVYKKPVQLEDGYHLLILTGKRPELKRTFEQAKRSIRHKLLREKKDAAMAALLERLRGEITVEVDEEALEAIKVEVPDLPDVRGAS